MEHDYSEYSEALRMLENECEPLKFEVFLTFIGMIADGALKKYSPADVMLHAMMEWDL